MKLPAILAASMLLIVSGNPAIAQDRPIQVFSFPGDDSCGTWTASRANPSPRDLRDEILQGWVMGFVSGHNFYTDSAGMTGHGVSPDALFAWVDNYCKANPLESVITASVKLVAALRARSTE